MRSPRTTTGNRDSLDYDAFAVALATLRAALLTGRPGRRIRRSIPVRDSSSHPRGTPATSKPSLIRSPGLISGPGRLSF